MFAPAFGMADLLRQHVRHPVGRRPHALADLRPAAQPARQADIDVLVLVRLDPRGVAHLVLADHRTGLDRGVDLVAGAVEEAGVDEHHAILRRVDARLQVDRGAPLLVHDAHLQRVAREAQHVLDAREDRVGECHLLGAVHLRLDDIDRAGPAVAQRPLPFRSCIAISDVTAASSRPSGVSPPDASSTASVYMWWPTLRTSMRLRPGKVSVPPPGVV